MTKGFTNREIDIIFQKLELKRLDICNARKEVKKLINKLFEQDTYGYYQCHKCEDDCDCCSDCEPKYD